MSLAKANEKLKFDTRMTEFNLNHGLVTPEEIKQNLQSVADCSALVLMEDKNTAQSGNGEAIQ